MYSLDTETYEEKDGELSPILDTRKFKVGELLREDGRSWTFEDAEEMYQFILQTGKENAVKGRRTNIYGHNTEYDWYAIAKSHLLDNPDPVIMYHPFYAKLPNKISILDTMAFYRCSLAEAAKSVNLKKMEMPKNPKTIKEIKPYLHNDCVITLELMKALKRGLEQLGFRPRRMITAGQLAMTNFLTYLVTTKQTKGLMHYNKETKINEIIKSPNAKLTRRAFKGGNNTAYQLGYFPATTLIDMNAMYPYSMSTMQLPNLKTERLIEQPSTQALTRIMEMYTGTARCTVTAPDIAFGLLSINYEGMQYQPTNRKLTADWTLPELQLAIQEGYIIEECEYVIIYEKLLDNPFKQYYQNLYELRKSSNTEQALAIKLIMNNLYGKFAQNRTNKERISCHRSEAPQKRAEGYEVIAAINETYVMQRTSGEYSPTYTNPIISALTTATARIKLWQTMMKIPYDMVLYCDTDSILFKGNTQTIQQLDYGKDMGQWKVQATGPARIVKEKTYYIADTLHASGLPKRELTKAALDNQQPVNYQRMISLPDALQRNRIDLIGSFENVSMDMTSKSKMNNKLPEHIVEELK